MKTNDQVQEEFSKIEQKFLKTRSKFRTEKSFRSEKALKEYNKALQQLKEFKEKLDGTASFEERIYSVRCESCGQIIGVSCEKPPETYKCGFCGETTQIKYKIIKNASY